MTPDQELPDEGLDRLTTEATHPDTAELDRMTALEIVDVMRAEDAGLGAALAAAREPLARLVDVVAEGLRRGGRLIYFGAGTSGRLGVLDAVECYPTFGAADGQVVGRIAGGDAAFLRAVEGAEDDPALGARDVADLAVGGDDVVVGIAASGRTPYVIGAVEAGRAAGAFGAAVVCNPGSPLAGAAELAVEVVPGPEVLAGSTRLKAGTVTKMVLNTITTGAFVRLGKCYGNRMVDVVATNHKLVHRSIGIVADVTGADRKTARAVLERCDGEVKTALVVALCEVTPVAARRALEDHEGRVRGALEALR